MGPAGRSGTPRRATCSAGPGRRPEREETACATCSGPRASEWACSPWAARRATRSPRPVPALPRAARQALWRSSARRPRMTRLPSPAQEDGGHRWTRSTSAHADHCPLSRLNGQCRPLRWAGTATCRRGWGRVQEMVQEGARGCRSAWPSADRRASFRVWGERSGCSRANSFPWSRFPSRQARPGPGPHIGCPQDTHLAVCVFCARVSLCCGGRWARSGSKINV